MPQSRHTTRRGARLRGFQLRGRVSRGFTLIEVMIALAIVVALTAIAMPLVRKSGPESRIMEAADRVRMAVARARERSARDGSIWEVRVSQDSRAQWDVKASAMAPLADAEKGEKSPADGSADDARWLLITPDGGTIELRELLLSADSGRSLKITAGPMGGRLTTSWIDAPRETEP